MNIIINMAIIIFSSIMSSFIFSMIILSSFFGIPQTIKLKKEKVLLESASIKPYLITIIVWSTIISIILLFLYNILNNEFFFAVVIGMILAFFNSLSSLSAKNFQTNMEELLTIQSKHLNSNFVSFVDNGVKDVFLKKADEIAKLRGFNNWNELEEIFISENEITKDLDKMTIEERLNSIANTVGFNNFNELYDFCIEEGKNTND